MKTSSSSPGISLDSVNSANSVKKERGSRGKTRQLLKKLSTNTYDTDSSPSPSLRKFASLLDGSDRTFVMSPKSQRKPRPAAVFTPVDECPLEDRPKVKSLRSKPFHSSASSGTITVSRSEERRDPSNNSVPIANAKVIVALASALPSRLDMTKSSQRLNVLSELYSSEISYLKGLNVLERVYQDNLGPVLSIKEREVLFLDSNLLAYTSGEFLLALRERLKGYDELNTTVGDIVTALAGRLHVYRAYCAGHEASEKLYDKVRDRKAVVECLQLCNGHSSVLPGLTLQAYLLTPVQRLARYPLLVKDLLKRTHPSHPDHELLSRALNELEEAAQAIDYYLQEQRSAAAADSLKKITTLESYLEEENRIIHHEGLVGLRTPQKVHKCILFNDYLIFINEMVVTLALPLESVWMYDVGHRDPQTTQDNALEILTPERPYSMYVRDGNDKKLWLSKVRTLTMVHLEQKDYLQTNAPGIESLTGLTGDRISALNATALDSMTRQFEYSVASQSYVYKGAWCDGLHHGDGVQTYTDGTEFSGQWVEGEREGDGVIKYPTGGVYTGPFRDHKQNGHGVMQFWNNDLYMGNWKDSLPHGAGKFDFFAGHEFVGHFENGSACGTGTLTCVDGSKYDGEFKCSLYHGSGFLRNSIGDEYEGNLALGKPSGRGTMNYADGGVYVGFFQSGDRHGSGDLQGPDGSSYCGLWKHDLMHGKGKLIDNIGCVYEGFFEFGHRHGKGRVKWASGNVYKGEFANDQMHGTGVLTLAGGRGRYRGSFAHDQKHGQGVMLLKNKLMVSCYDGEWKHDQRNGRGKWIVRKLPTTPTTPRHNGEQDKSKDKPTPNGQEEQPSKELYSSQGKPQNDLSVQQGYLQQENPHDTVQGEEQNVEHGGKIEENVPVSVTVETVQELEAEEEKSDLDSLAPFDGNEHVERYEGDWCNGRPHGRGEYSHNNSEVLFSGLFTFGRRTGRGVEISTSGQLTGTWVAGKRDGKFTALTPQGTSFTSQWTSDVLSGKHSFAKNDLVCFTEVYRAGDKLTKFRDALHPPNLPMLKPTLL